MKRTKKLSIADYHPMRSTFSVQKIIQDRVNREAWASVDIQNPPPPKYVKRSLPLTPATAYIFAKNFVRSLAP